MYDVALVFLCIWKKFTVAVTIAAHGKIISTEGPLDITVTLQVTV